MESKLKNFKKINESAMKYIGKKFGFDIIFYHEISNAFLDIEVEDSKAIDILTSKVEEIFDQVMDLFPESLDQNWYAEGSVYLCFYGNKTVLTRNYLNVFALERQSLQFVINDLKFEKYISA